MKVLMMHRDDGLSGGAQIQMNRLRGALRARGVDARLLCREGSSGETVRMPYRRFPERWIGAITKRMGFNELHLVSSHDVRKLPEVMGADVLDLHCLHSGTFSYAALPALTAGIPTVFTFHDMWPLTGHCHASLECDRWKSGCGKCPHLGVEPAVRRDATALEWRMKRDAFRRSRFTIVTPSRWLADRVGESVLADFPILQIPHGVDVGVFKPLDRRQCREILGLSMEQIVLLCAIDNMDRPLKGAELLERALSGIPESLRSKCVLLLIGRSSPSFAERIPMRVLDLGYLNEDRLKIVAYAAADLTVNPTRAESFGLVCLESLACGTPVAAFQVGGVPELVQQGVTGGLAKPGSPASLADVVVELLSDRTRLAEMGLHARNFVIKEHAIDLQAKRYIELYQRLSDEISAR